MASIEVLIDVYKKNNSYNLNEHFVEHDKGYLSLRLRQVEDFVILHTVEFQIYPRR